MCAGTLARYEQTVRLSCKGTPCEDSEEDAANLYGYTGIP